MAFKTFSPGVLTSSDVNTFLMRQAIIVCTSATRPAAPNEGMTIYETDTDKVLSYSGTAWQQGYEIGAWRTYTPTFLNAGAGTDSSLGNGTADGRFIRIGRLVVVHVRFVLGSTSVIGTKILGVSVPVTGLTYTTGSRAVGTSNAVDTSTSEVFGGVCELSSGGNFLTPLSLLASGTYGRNVSYTTTVPFTWATGDVINCTFQYEAATG